MSTIEAKADPNVETIHGINNDPELGDNIKVTVIATGFQNRNDASASNESQRRAESAPLNEIISVEDFNRMRGQGSGRSNDGYLGIIRHTNFKEDLEVPTALRRYDPNTDSNKSGKSAGKDA
jgi:cell division protein FtsZ